jgi:glucose/arabinose dehydrogenase
MCAPAVRRAPRPRLGRSIVVGTSLALVAVTLGFTAPTSTAAGNTVIGTGSGRCLDVTGNVATSRTPVNIFDCNGQPNQAWTLTPAGELRVFDDSMCLDVRGAATTKAAIVQIYPCHGMANQQWRVGTDGTIVGVQSGLCLDVKGASTANSAPVQLWTCHARNNQQWQVTTDAADTTPPSVPANPRTSDLTCDSVTFAWDASTDDVGIAFYDVFHDGQLMTTVSGSATSTRLTLVPGAKWGLYVNARDAAGNVSQASSTVPIDVPQCAPDTQAPTAPTALIASAAGTSVSLSWAASTDDVGVRAYDIFRDAAKVGSVSGTGTNPPTTTFVDSGLQATTTYEYSVVARDAQDNGSDPSNIATVTTGTACANAVCEVDEVATDTDIPWGLVTLSDGTILYTRRDAHDIVRLDPATGAKTTVGTVPNVESTDGEGGLLGLAISPTFDTDRWLYIMHTSPDDNRIVRIKMIDDRLDTTTEEVLVSGILRNKYHNGGRLRFGPDGTLYAATGDAQNGDYAQDLDSLNGKVLRLNPDGTIPADNPFGTYVWSYGHRNPQGLAFDAQGRLWQQEFGNSQLDETNLVVRGGNYGWPACEGTVGACDTPGFIAPKRTYATSEGSCSGITIVRDALYVACGRGARMYRQTISGDSLTDLQTYFNGTYGRLRTVEPAPDGGLWLTTTNSGDKDSTPNNSDERIFHVALGG